MILYQTFFFYNDFFYFFTSVSNKFNTSVVDSAVHYTYWLVNPETAKYVFYTEPKGNGQN